MPQVGLRKADFARALADTLPGVRGCLSTADALHTQRGHPDYLARRGGHYLFTVKDNQPKLRPSSTSRAPAITPVNASIKIDCNE